MGSVTTLGRARRRDTASGRWRSALGPQHDCVSVCEDAERFWQRRYALAVAWGLGGGRIRRVVVVAHGPPWVCHRVEPSPASSEVEVVQVVDLWHARQRIWEAAHAARGEGSGRARPWAEPLCLPLAQAGPGPVLRAWAGVAVRSEGGHCVANVRAAFREHAARRVDPSFAAAGLPLGSGTWSAPARWSSRQGQGRRDVLEPPADAGRGHPTGAPAVGPLAGVAGVEGHPAPLAPPAGPRPAG